MAILQVNNGTKPVAAPQNLVPNLPTGDDLDQLRGEINHMLARLASLASEMPDIVIRDCMAFMGRLTEMHVGLIRIEAQNRKAKFFRTSEVQRLMELCDFQFKSASRLVEIARQEVDLSR